MKVILLDNIRGVGQIGDVKDVSDGYGRNFLLPRGKAKAASAGALKNIAATLGKRMASVAVAKAEAEAVAGKLSGTVIELTGRANEQGTLFAAITAVDIATELSSKTGMHFDASRIVLPEPLKAVGEHPVSVELTEGVAAQITVSLKAN